MYIVQNTFSVSEEHRGHFEEQQHAAPSVTTEVPGRLMVARLKGDEPGVFANLSVWESRAAFEAWRDSDNFKQAHAGGPPMEGVFTAPPQLASFEVLRTDGGIPVSEAATTGD